MKNKNKKQHKIKPDKIKHDKVKRRIYLRTFSALMGAYLVLMAGFSFLTLNQQSKLENSHYYQFSMNMNYTVEDILQNNMDSNNQIIDMEKFKKECRDKLSSAPYAGIEMAIFTRNCDLIYNTDSINVEGKDYVQKDLINMVTDKDRLQEVINEDHYDNVDRISLVAARYYCPVPYHYKAIREYNSETGYVPNDEVGAYWAVFGFQTNLLNNCFTTLLFVWISCFVLFMAVALLLSTQNYRVYRKRVELDKMRSETTNALAHDLKTPLSIISGYAQNLMENIHTEKRAYYAENINANVNRMDRIIREMLELSRFNDTEYNQLVYEEVSLGEVCTKLMDRYRQVCSDKQLTVTLEGDAIVKSEFSLTERVIDNFFVNALDYTPDAGAIHIRIFENTLEFYNSGSHIPEDVFHEIWEPYKKADDSRSIKKGSGLGLSISSKILNLYKFSYGAKNENNGVTFWFKW